MIYGYPAPAIKLVNKVKQERQDKIIYPPKGFVFNAFKQCPFDSVKVIILGQDPYHGDNQAHGLSFSVKNECVAPPSLRNIKLEFKKDLNKEIDNDLTMFANKGVLFLNSILTVEKGKPLSHKHIGWEEYTDSIIKYISDNKDKCVFMLWGNYAKTKSHLIDKTKHLCLYAVHPSPLSANKGGWFNTNHFSKTNKFLEETIF